MNVLALARRLVPAAALLLMTACSISESSSSTAPTTQAPPSGPVFHKDVEPILQRACQGCHMPGGIAPLALVEYEQAKPLAGLIAQKTKDRSMPPWGAVGTGDCSPRLGFKNDARLREDEIATLEAWSAAGAPEGDPKDAPPGRSFAPETLAGAQQTLAPKTPFVAQGDHDEYRCFVLDPKLATTSWVNGTFVVPGNRTVVHHAVIVADPNRKSLALAGSDGSWDCFGGVNIDDAQLLAVWTPGQDPFELPSNVGMPVQAGSLLVMQIHYHPAGVVADPDTTSLELRYLASKPEYFLAPATPIGNYPDRKPNGDGLQPEPDDGKSGPEFLIPANVKNHVEEMVLTVPAPSGGGTLPDVWVYGAAAHMHYIGVDEQIFLERAAPSKSEPAKECLLHEPSWKFEWQRIYAYDAKFEDLPLVKVGDKIRVRCTYDNTLDNPGTVRSVKDNKTPGPIDVHLGEQTTDEMCLALLPLLYKAP